VAQQGVPRSSPDRSGSLTLARAFMDECPHDGRRDDTLQRSYGTAAARVACLPV